jgi:hypothetical protein
MAGAKCAHQQRCHRGSWREPSRPCGSYRAQDAGVERLVTRARAAAPAASAPSQKGPGQGRETSGFLTFTSGCEAGLPGRQVRQSVPKAVRRRQPGPLWLSTQAATAHATEVPSPRPSSLAETGTTAASITRSAASGASRRRSPTVRPGPPRSGRRGGRCCGALSSRPGLGTGCFGGPWRSLVAAGRLSSG